MIFKIELDDFWMDEDDNIESSLKTYIISDVVRTIKKSIEDKINEQIVEKVDEAMDKQLGIVINSTLAELMSTKIITVNKEQVTIEDHLKDIFEKNIGWRNPAEQIKQFAKKFGENMKVQYNAAFANQIVVNMKEQGFLKDDVTKILLEGKRD